MGRMRPSDVEAGEMSKRILSAVLLAATVAVAAAGAAPATAATKGCMTRGKTVMANRYVRVYETSGELYDLSYWSCSVWSRRPVYLLDGVIGGNTPLIAIAGRFVAAVPWICSGGDHEAGAICDGRVVVHDAKRRRSWETILPRLGRDGPGQVTSVVVTARGWVAWSACRTTYELLEVWAMAPGGALQSIDAAPPVGPPSNAVNDSLAVNGDRLYWEAAGVPRSRLLR